MDIFSIMHYAELTVPANAASVLQLLTQGPITQSMSTGRITLDSIVSILILFRNNTFMPKGLCYKCMLCMCYKTCSARTSHKLA